MTLGIRARLTNAARLLRGKSLDDSALLQLHPELQGIVHIATLRSDEGAPPQHMAGATRVYQEHVWVRKAIDTLAANLAPLPVRAIDAEGHPLEAHPLTEVLAYVNADLSPADLWRQWMVDMMLYGEAGWELSKSLSGARYLEIWPRQGQRVTVIADPDLIDYYGVAAYEVQSVHSERVRRLPPEEFLLYKFYNPGYPWRGISPVAAVAMGVQLDALAQAWSLRAFKRGGHWDFALIAPEGMTRSEKRKLEAEFRTRYMGDSDAPFPIFEQGITDIKPLNWAPKDMEWMAQRQFSREEIGGIFGVPNEIMGFGKDTYENFDTAYKVLWRLTVAPLAGFRDSALTEFARRVGLLEKDERAATDLSGVPALREDITEALEGAALLLDRGTPFNVVNERLGLGFPALEGGDVGYRPVGQMPAMAAPGVSLPEAVDEDTPPDGPEEDIDMPASEDNDATEPDADGKALPPSACATHSAEIDGDALPAGATSLLPEYGSDEHAAYLEKQAARLTPHLRDFKRQLLHDFERQHEEVRRRLLEMAEGEAAVPAAATKAATAAVFNLKEEAGRFEGQYEAYFALLVEDVGAEELAQIVSDLDFDMQSDDVQMALAAHLKAFALKTNQTTWTDLISLFQAAEAEGLGIPEIVEQLDLYYDGRKADWQRERIARTTLGGAQNAATLEAYRQSGVAEGSQWVSALKSTTRPAHRAAHGQFRRLGELFDIGGEKLAYPGDPDASAGNIVNCMCAMIVALMGVGPDEDLKPPEEESEEEV